MRTIFQTVYKILSKNHGNETQDFIRGYKACFEYFKIGYEKNDQYNLEIQIFELEKELERISEELVKKRKNYINLKQQFIDYLDNITPDNKNLNDKLIKRKSRLNAYEVLFSNSSDSDKLKYFEDLMSNWNK